jgi:hypothetical protein
VRRLGTGSLQAKAWRLGMMCYTCMSRNAEKELAYRYERPREPSSRVFNWHRSYTLLPSVWTARIELPVSGSNGN